jgi:hypothetical protein
VIVCEPPADVVYVTEQLLLLPTGEPSVQLELAKEPPPEVEKFTVPSGGKAAAPDASDTVAVQVVAPPWVTEAGVQLTLVVLPRLTVNVCAFERPPPGAGLTTVMGKLPFVVRSLARIAAVNCVELTNVVARAEPLN